MENLCPLPGCRTVLDKTAEGEFDSWVCPKGHGVAASLTELWGYAQDDEIRTLWQAVKSAPKNDLMSPALGSPMVSVTITIDSDEVHGNVGPDARTLTFDVADQEQMVWFDPDELRQLFPDLPNPEPTAGDLATIQTIASQFGASWKRAQYDQMSSLKKLSWKISGVDVY